MAVVVDSTAVEADIGNCYSFSPCEIPRTGFGPSGFFMRRASARPVFYAPGFGPSGFLCAGPWPVRLLCRNRLRATIACRSEFRGLRTDSQGNTFVR